MVTFSGVSGQSFRNMADLGYESVIGDLDDGDGSNDFDAAEMTSEAETPTKDARSSVDDPAQGAELLVSRFFSRTRA